MKNKKINVSILGATGYAGAEIIRILYGHPNVEKIFVASTTQINEDLTKIYKNLIGLNNYTLIDYDSAIDFGDIIFAAIPHGKAQEIALKCLEKNKILIDLSADFRLSNEEDYIKWYNEKFINKEIHEKSVYGLPEINREKIKELNIIANPGCYPTSISLALYPLLKERIVNPKNIIIDAKSGVTGAGKSLSANTHFPDCNENFSPYKIGEHRHIPEIEEILSFMYGEKINVTFTPHLLPINRGILSTIYCDRENDLVIEKIYDLYKNFYKDEYFIKILPLGETSCIKNVSHSNFCHISIHEEKRTNKLIIISCIDNMIKGAAGQAIQNMNIRFGFDEKTSIDFLPTSF